MSCYHTGEALGGMKSRGFPDVVVMKWRGNDNERAGAAKKHTLSE